MKKQLFIGLLALCFLCIFACSSNENNSEQPFSSNHNSNNNIASSLTSADQSAWQSSSETGTYFSSIDIPEASNIEEPENTGSFNLVTSDGAFTNDNNIYTITKGGTYTLSGVLNGQVIVSAPSSDEVGLDLNGVTIEYNQDSPIKILTCDKTEISAKSGSKNLIKDNRAVKTVDNESVGEGAINAKTDLKLKGSGTLVVVGNYNNGVHTSDDLKIQNLTLQSTAVNNALKGNDSVTITSGTINAYSTNGQGIKTKNSDVSSKGNQRGTIEIDGGNIFVDSLYDAIDASYNVVIDQSADATPTNISIKTGTKCSYYKSSSFDKEASAKGLKATNEILIKKGTIVVAASDDAVHANYGDALENGSTGQGNITISGGALSIASGDDGLHADNTLTINDGSVIVTGATEGFEANHIKINGGYSHIYGTDDGVNASKKIDQTPTIEVTGGTLDVAVTNGDTDGIDSNGNFSQTGGLVISRGSPGTGSGMSTGLDCDGTASITGGTFIAFNGMEKTPTTGSNVLKAVTNYTAQGGPGGPGGGHGGGGPGGHRADTTSTSYSFAAGDYVLSGSGIEISFTNNFSYSGFMIYSSLLTNGGTYSLTTNGTKVLSWTQSSSNVTIQ